MKDTTTQYQAVLQMSVDSFARLADSRRSAKEIIEMMAAAAIKKKDNDWRPEFLKMQCAFRSKRNKRK